MGKKIFKWTSIGVLSGVLCILFLTSLLIGREYFIVNNTSPMKANVIVVLGYPAQIDGEPSSTMKIRVEKAVELFQNGYAKTLIMTGSSAKNQFIEAEVMANYAYNSLGIPMNAIIQEPNSTDTFENAKYSVDIMRQHEWNSAIVVTTPYHTRRAFILFSNLGINVSVISSDFPAGMEWFHHIENIIYEYIAFTWFKINGKM